MSYEFRIWFRDESGQLAAQVISSPLWVSGDSSIPSAVRRGIEAGICPIAPRSGAIGAALVPDERDRAVLLNGVPLRPGLHLVQHADCLNLDVQTFWFAAVRTVDETTYDPAVHGAELFCELTKARLEPGEPIVLCPGSPEQPCRAVFRRPAWELAMQSETMRRCAHCGFRPDESDWTPNEPQPQRTFDEFYRAIVAHPA